MNPQQQIPVSQQTLIIDRVRFLMPKDRELQFPAITIVQSYVNNFDAKWKANVYNNPRYRFELRYDVAIADEDWAFFRKAGLALPQDREPLNDVDAEFDLTEEKLAQFDKCEKHVCQVYGALTGVGCPPLPEIRRVLPGKQWWVLGSYDGDDLLALKDDICAGFIGKAGWETYLAAAMGLPVIEYCIPGRPRNWLSKWTNPYYRVIDEAKGNVQLQIESAVASIEQVLTAQKKAA